mmetsp:Transcript_25172/g.54792  ORF Transcript_25172/g.54792 Transcript_25172/m.54792 type:complete len:275 (-) Transcript_25172:476-1300(-)
MSGYFDECGVCDGDESSCASGALLSVQLASTSADPAAVAAELYPSIVSTLAVDPSRVVILWMTIDGQYAPLGALVNPAERAVLAANGRRLLRTGGGVVVDLEMLVAPPTSLDDPTARRRKPRSPSACAACLAASSTRPPLRGRRPGRTPLQRSPRLRWTCLRRKGLTPKVAPPRKRAPLHGRARALSPPPPTSSLASSREGSFKEEAEDSREPPPQAPPEPKRPRSALSVSTAAPAEDEVVGRVGAGWTQHGEQGALGAVGGRVVTLRAGVIGS